MAVRTGINILECIPKPIKFSAESGPSLTGFSILKVFASGLKSVLKNFMGFGIHSFIILIIITALNNSFQKAYSQEKDDQEIKDVQDTVEAEVRKTDFFNFDYKIRLQEEATYNKINNNRLINPNNDFASNKNYYSRTIFEIDSKALFGKYFDLNFHDQLTWKWQEKEKFAESETKNYLQELFLTGRILDTLIIDTGRENIVSGVAYGWNPTDYMMSASISADPDPRVLREQRLGTYLIKASLFFEPGQISALYSPKIDGVNTNNSAKQLYKISVKPFDRLVAEFLFFNGRASQNNGKKRNSLGSNLELTLTDDLILHFEGSATKGSDVTTVGSHKVYGNSYYDFIERKKAIYAKAVFGLNYTLPDLHNIIIEFYYNGEGYSRKEWERYFAMLDYSKTRYNSGTYEISPGINPYNIYISAANSMLQLARMSRYYLFLRLSKQNIFINNLDYSFFSYINLYDRSLFLNINPEYSFLNRFRTGIIYSYYLGKQKSEFGISANRYAVLGYLGVYF